MAWNLYLYDGDRETLQVTYDPICRYLRLMEQMETEEGIIDFGLGDWCAPDREFNGPKCPSIITDTGYYHIDFRLAAKMASILGKPEEAQRFTEKADAIKKAFIARFVDADTGSMLSDSQTAYACALHQQLVDGELARKVGNHLIEQVRKADYHLDTGILGTKYLFTALSSIGRDDIAYRIVTNPTYPGWAYEIAQGATTIWEHWDGQKSQMHHMFSDVDSWFYRFLVGMAPDPEEPGYRHTVFHPALGCGLESATCSHESPYGTVAIAWKVHDKEFELELTIPPLCRGTLVLPKNASIGKLPTTFAAGVHRMTGTL